MKATPLWRWAEPILAGAVVAWRLFRYWFEFGPHTDWVLLVGLLWLAVSLRPPRWQRADGYLLVPVCVYLLIVYGYFQLNATVGFVWAWLEGG